MDRKSVRIDEFENLILEREQSFELSRFAYFENSNSHECSFVCFAYYFEENIFIISFVVVKSKSMR